MRARFGFAAAAGVALATAAAAHAQQPPQTLRFCLAADNMPFARASPPAGIEVELARRIAAGLGQRALFRWADATQDVEAQVLEGRCDAAFGAIEEPGSMADGLLLPGGALTEPYHSAGYLLIRHQDAPPVHSLDEIESRIAVEMESIPIYTLKQRGHSVFALDDYEAVIRAVAERRVDYGYIWGPLAAWLLRDREDVVLVDGFQAQDRWNFTLVVRADDPAFRDALSAAILELRRTGEVERIFAAHGIPYLPPA